MIKCYVHMNQKVISCRVASAVVALEVIFLGNNHSNREAQCLVRKDMGPWTIIIAVATPVPDSQHKQTNRGHLCLHILHEVEIWTGVTDALRTDGRTDFER